MAIMLDGDVDHYLACGDREGTPSPHRNLASSGATTAMRRVP
jgi:hypothetical protein